MFVELDDLIHLVKDIFRRHALHIQKLKTKLRPIYFNNKNVYFYFSQNLPNGFENNHLVKR